MRPVVAQGVDAETRGELNLLVQPSGYKYLCTCVDVPTLNDPKDFAEVEQAFKELGFKDEEKKGLYAIVASILALGNVDFKETSPDQAGVVKETKKYVDA